MNLKHYLIMIACGACVALAVQASDTNTNRWESAIAAGVTLTSGNSDTLLANVNFLTGKKWDKNELAFGADGTYGESDFKQDDGTTKTETTAQSARGFGQYNRLFSEKFYGYMRVEGLHDHIADIDYRFTFSPGVGYYFIKNDRTLLRGEIGPGYLVERQGGEDNDYATLRLAERLEHKLNDRAKIWESVEFLPQVDDWNNFIINAEIGIETSITKTFALRVYLQDTYDNEPAPDRDQNDLKLFAGVAYKF